MYAEIYKILTKMSYDNLCPRKPIKYPTLNHCLNVYRQLHMKLTRRTHKPPPTGVNRIHLILIRPLSSVPTHERRYLGMKVHRNLELLNSFPEGVKVRGIVKENAISVFTSGLPVVQNCAYKAQFFDRPTEFLGCLSGSMHRKRTERAKPFGVLFDFLRDPIVTNARQLFRLQSATTPHKVWLPLLRPPPLGVQGK